MELTSDLQNPDIKTPSTDELIVYNTVEPPWYSGMPFNEDTGYKDEVAKFVGVPNDSLENLHRSEASVRNMPPIAFQTLLAVQVDLRKAGVKPDSLLKQRDELLKLVSIDDDDPILRGQKIALLDLAGVDLYKLSKVGLSSAVDALKSKLLVLSHTFFNLQVA